MESHSPIPYELNERSNSKAINLFPQMASKDVFERYRPLLFFLAYKMVGQISEVNRMMSETEIRWLNVDPELVNRPKLYLAKAVISRSLSHLKQYEIAREFYPGNWLPEPLLEGPSDWDMPLCFDRFLGYLRVLELINPRERAAYLLREDCDFGYDEISEAIGRPKEYCRKLYVRACEIMEVATEEFALTQDRHRHLLESFQRIEKNQQFGRLRECLDEEVVLYADGGGNVAAASAPIIGRKVVWGVIESLCQERNRVGDLRFARVNACPALLFSHTHDSPETVIVFEAVARQVESIYLIRNPDKLAHLKQESV